MNRMWRMVLVACLGIDSGVACVGGPATTPHVLSTGRTIRIISIASMSGSFGQALALSYQTDMKVNDVDGLRNEVAEIWADFRIEADKARVDTAIIMANEIPTGAIITHNDSFNFVFERKPDIGWAEAGAKVEGAAISQYGVYDMNAASVEVAPQTAAGKVRAARGLPRWAGSPNKIPRVKGTSFGYAFVVGGQPKGSPVDVKVIVEHPPFHNPGAAGQSARESWTQTVGVGMPSFVGFSLDEDWEMVAGRWIVRVYRGPRVLTEKEFVVE